MRVAFRNVERSGPAAIELSLAGKILVAIDNFTNRVQPAEGGEVYIRERQVDSGHPAFDGCLHSVRHLLGNHLNQVAVNHCSRHRFTSFLKKRMSAGLALTTEHRGPTTVLLTRRLSLHALHVIQQALLVLSHDRRQLGFLIGSQDL